MKGEHSMKFIQLNVAAAVLHAAGRNLNERNIS
jgi:hypothetical protein